jgi:hypothetical protein
MTGPQPIVSLSYVLEAKITLSIDAPSRQIRPAKLILVQLEFVLSLAADRAAGRLARVKRSD